MSIVIIGSSTAFGQGEDFANLAAPGDRGVFARMLANNIGNTTLAAGSQTLAQWVATSTRRMAVITAVAPTHIICALGANDMLAGASAATIQSNLQTMWSQLQATGATIIQATIQPTSSSTDGWTTVGGQTSTFNTVRVAVNNYIRGKPSPVSDIIDLCAALENSPGTGIWRVSGGAWTTDGIHTTRHADAAAALAGDYTRIWGGGTPQTVLTTGNASEDLWDSLILKYAAQYGHPRPRVLKAQMKWESDQIFDVYCTSSDTPCGIFPGWTSLESRSFGLLQVTPACGESGGGRMLLANGHPNMAREGDAGWAGSVYNPELNTDAGVHAITEAYDYFKGLFPTCTTDTLVLMAAAGYVGNWSDITGCGVWTSQLQIQYVSNVKRIYEEWWGTYPTTGGYDLVVDSISWSPTTPTQGQAVTFSAVIRNAGTAPTPAGVIHGIGFRIDGGPTTLWSDNNTTSLAGGATRSQTVNGGTGGVTTWTATSGAHTITATVDDVNRMPDELDNNNNSLTVNITVSDPSNVIRVNAGGSWQTAIDAAQPGDTILIAPGVYNATGSGRGVIIDKSGTASLPITLKGDGGRAILDCSNVTGSSFTIGLGLTSANYWRFENISVRNTKQLPTTAAIGIHVYNSSNNLFNNCESYGHQGPGIQIEGNAGNNVIQYSNIYSNFDPTETGSGGSGGQADGIDFYAIADGYTGNRVMYCRVYDNSDDGIDLWESEEVIHIEGTFCYRNGYVPGTTTTAGDGNGFKLGRNFTYPPHEVISCRAYNNRANGFDSNAGGGNMIISDNASYGNGGSAYSFYAPATPIMTNNITYDPGTPAINPGTYAIT